MYGNAKIHRSANYPPFYHKYGARSRGGLGGTNNIRRVFLSSVELLYDSCFELTYKIQKRKERDVIVRRGEGGGGEEGGVSARRWEYRRGDIPPR